MAYTPFAGAAAAPPPDDGASRAPSGRASAAPAPPAAASLRPPLPPRAASGHARGSNQLSNIMLDDSFDSLLPLSPSLDNFLTQAGCGLPDSRALSLLPSGRLFSVGAGRLSGASSFDLNWLLAEGGRERGPASNPGDGGDGDGPEGMQLDLPAPAAPPKQQQQQQQAGLPLQRRPSTGELLLGSAQPAPQLPAVAPLHMPQAAKPASPGAATGPLTPPAADAARRAAAASAALSLQHLQQQYHEQLALQQQAAAAAAAAASAALAAGQDPAQSYAAQYSAAAAHAAQALALQRQLQVQQALLASCGYPGAASSAGTAGTAGASPQGGFPTDLLSSYGASQAAAIAAIYGQQAQHSRQGTAGPASPAASGGAAPVPGSPASPGAAPAWGAGSTPGPAWAGGLAAAVQPATPPTQRRGGGPPTLQDKIEEWERQNALMAAFTAGSPCPDLAAASLTQHSLPWAAPLGGLSGYGCMPGMVPLSPMPAVPQAVPSYPAYAAMYTPAYQQPRSLQVTLSTAPKVRLSTAGATEGKPSPTTGSVEGAAAGAASTGAAAAAAGGSGPSSTSVSGGTAPSDALPASLAGGQSQGPAPSDGPEDAIGMDVSVKAE